MPKFDRDLIFLYAENCRAKIKDLSVKLRKSPQRLKYNLSVLEKEGIVENPHCIFDYSYFGLVLFRVYFRGGYVSEKDKSNIIKKLIDNPYVTSVYELSGEFDLAVEIESPNPSRFNKEFKKIIDAVPTLNSYTVILNLVSHIYPRLYLTKANAADVPHEIILGGDRTVQQFDKHETAVMMHLLQNPRLRLSALADKADINIKTAAAVFKQLQKKRIIRGFKYVVNTNKLGIFKSRLFLTLHNISQEREKELLDYLLKTREIVQVSKTIGDWNIEVDIESLDKARVRSIIVQMREDFRDLIETFNIIEFYQYYKKSYLPQYLFTEG